MDDHLTTSLLTILFIDDSRLRLAALAETKRQELVDLVDSSRYDGRRYVAQAL